MVRNPSNESSYLFQVRYKLLCFVQQSQAKLFYWYTRTPFYFTVRDFVLLKFLILIFKLFWGMVSVTGAEETSSKVLVIAVYRIFMFFYRVSRSSHKTFRNIQHQDIQWFQHTLLHQQCYSMHAICTFQYWTTDRRQNVTVLSPEGHYLSFKLLRLLLRPAETWKPFSDLFLKINIRENASVSEADSKYSQIVSRCIRREQKHQINFL